MTHPIESAALHEEVKQKTALLGGKSGKIVLVMNQSNGRIVEYGVHLEFPRKSVA